MSGPWRGRGVVMDLVSGAGGSVVVIGVNFFFFVFLVRRGFVI